MITTLPPSPPWTPVSDITGPPRPPSKLETTHTPASIPLPPSPPPTKQSLPTRRPPSAPQSSRRVSSNARISSGRRVSGALQYALQEDQPREVSGVSSLDLAYYEQMREEVIADDQTSNEQPQWESTLGFGGSMPDVEEGMGGVVEEDEEWMGYVRQQLNTLFPDLFHSGTIDSGVPSLEEEDGGDVSISTIATTDLPTPPLTGAELDGTHGSLQLIGSSVPNVREEISGLREEIERMRGVVSGLAENLRPPTVNSAVQVNETGVVEGPLSPAFYKTAHITANIIRLLTKKVDGAQSSDGEESEAVFGEENLGRILDLVANLPEKPAQDGET